MAKCWFTAKTVQGNNKIFSEGSLSPTIEITIQDPNAVYSISSSRSSYFGAGSDIPGNLFNFLNRNESFDGDQKLHIPMDEQSESAMIFKQRTIETSVSRVSIGGFYYIAYLLYHAIALCRKLSFPSSRYEPN
jgi:hypothetical protein